MTNVTEIKGAWLFFLPPLSDELQFLSVTSGFARLIMETKYVCHGLISLNVNFHNNRTMWSTNLLVKICRGGGGGEEKEPGAFNSAEVQQCRKRRENFGIIYTHFIKSGEITDPNYQRKSLQFRRQNVCNSKLNYYFGAKTCKLHIFSLKILKFYSRL